MAYSSGMGRRPSRSSIDAIQYASFIATQSAGRFAPGVEPPPLSTEPRPCARTSSGVVEARSAWIIWPSFWSTVMRDSSASTRASMAT